MGNVSCYSLLSKDNAEPELLSDDIDTSYKSANKKQITAMIDNNERDHKQVSNFLFGIYEDCLLEQDSSCDGISNQLTSVWTEILLKNQIRKFNPYTDDRYTDT